MPDVQRHKAFLGLFVGLVVGAAHPACRRATPSQPSAAAKPRVMVLVAASAQDAVVDAANAFMSRHPCEIVVTAGPSNSQTQQIIAGAEGDLFLSANVSWADEVEKKGLSQRRVNLLSNSLVIVTPNGNPAAIHAPKDLALPRVLRVALAGESVPAGIYARQALKAVGVYGDLEEHAKIVYGQDVRAALAYAAAGEVEAATVYATDAQGESRVETVYTFAPETHDAIVYPLLLLKHAADNPSAQAFFDDLLTTETAAIFERRGFRRAG